MAIPPKILALAGSARRESFNRKLLRIAIDGARQAGAEVTLVEMSDFPLPLFDQDCEQARGIPEPAVRLKKLALEHAGLLLACPEYNSSITPLLKNTIDWLSRSLPGEGPLAAFQGKIAGLVAASPGALGGLRGLVHVRAILGNIGVVVLPEQIAVPKAHEAFDERGDLKDARQRDNVLGVGGALAKFLARLH